MPRTRPTSRPRSSTTKKRRRRVPTVGEIEARAALIVALMALEFLTVDQLAIVLDVDRSTARRELQGPTEDRPEGGSLQGKGFKVGKQWRIRPSAIRELSAAGGLRQAS
jgi:hypothetical protein